MFRLSRYYSIVSLAGIVVIVVLLSLFLRHLAVDTLLNHQTRSNVDLTHSYANSIWDPFDDFAAASEAWTVEELRQRPELEQLRRVTLAQMRGMSVAKVKVYNLAGMTVFSTEAGQIGEDKRNNRGFHAARAGEVASEIVFRNQFYAFEQTIMDRNLIATYLPIREQGGGPVKAVFEVYTDVTPLVRKMEATQLKIIGGVVLALMLLYLFLYLIVRRADRILTRHESERKENEDRIRHQAFHDSLTGLPNRDSFIQRIDEAIGRAKRHGKRGALLFLDLDRFKLINDSLGHDAGDQLLRIVASRIQKCLRETDMAFRMSGDEFVVVLEDLDKVECAALAAQRILEAMAAPVPLGGCEVIVNISIGITVFPVDGQDLEALVKEADSAMYRAKQTGHNHYEFYTPEMNRVAYERLSMETDLQRALQRDEFVLHYQPKIDTAKQFRNRSLVDAVRRALTKSGLEPRYLELELTESMFIENTERSIEMIQELKRLGVSLSIDDFGSGYSSLAYLKQFPVDYLKIDRSFIRDLATNHKDAAIAVAISALAHSLNLKLVAEGVENHEQVRFLEAQGCHELQGFLFGRAVTASELEATLRQQMATPAE